MPPATSVDLQTVISYIFLVSSFIPNSEQTVNLDGHLPMACEQSPEVLLTHTNNSNPKHNNRRAQSHHFSHPTENGCERAPQLASDIYGHHFEVISMIDQVVLRMEDEISIMPLCLQFHYWA